MSLVPDDETTSDDAGAKSGRHRPFDREMPGQQSLEIRREQLEVRREDLWSGPTPAPGDLEAYERILPRAADRILSMAERSLDSSIRIDERYANGEVSQGGWSLAVATLLSVAAGGAAFYFFARTTTR